MSVLRDLGIVQKDGGEAAEAFESLFPDFFAINYERPSIYIQTIWGVYKQKYGEGNNNRNGKIFEYILATLLLREALYPLYMSARVTFVPNVIYDLLLYSEERGAISLSAKTTLRERYKQADLEALALKNVYRRSLSYLITLDSTEAERLSRKINQGEVLGLNGVYVANSEDFDQLIDELKQYHYSQAPVVKTIEGTMIPAELVEQYQRGSHE